MGKTTATAPSSATSSTSPSPSLTTPTSSPTLSDFPSIGDAFPSRELLSSIIKGNGKALGYIFKCSVTSEHRVTYYCSNKYHAPRCMAGFKAAYAVGDKQWIVTEATEHNEGCTKLRQRVNGSNGIKTEGNYITPLPFKLASAVVSKDHNKATITSSTTNSSSNQKARNTFQNLRNFVSSSDGTASVNKQYNDNYDRQVITRKNRAYSTTSTSTYCATSPPSSIVNARRSSVNYGSRRALREVDENEALQEDDEGHSPTFNGSTSVNSRSAGSRRNSDNNTKRRKGGKTENRNRSSSSSSSTQSNKSEERRNMMITTILDPEFHFPSATLEASIKLQKTLPCRRKRSSSYVKNSTLLLGRFLENQEVQESQARNTAMTPGDMAGCQNVKSANNVLDETMSSESAD